MVYIVMSVNIVCLVWITLNTDTAPKRDSCINKWECSEEIQSVFVE